MIGNLRRLSDDDLKKLLAKPARIADYLYEDDDGFGPYVDMDVDKAWSGLNFLLTGDVGPGAFPLGFLVAGGTSIGDEDVGYGPARGFSNAQVKQIAEALKGLDRNALMAKYDPAQMASKGVYPAIWKRQEDTVRNFESLLEHFDEMREFIKSAAGAGQAMVVYLS